MKASLDTNVVIHLYRADGQEILFEVFKDEIFIYEQIRDVELEHHGRDILSVLDSDIAAGKIKVYTDEKLKEQGVKCHWGKTSGSAIGKEWKIQKKYGNF